LFSFWKKKSREASTENMYGVDYQYKFVLGISEDSPEDVRTEETADFEIKFVDFGFRNDSYTGEEIPLERILYTSKEKMTFSGEDVYQIHYGVLEVEDDRTVCEVLTSSSELPEQVKELLKNKGYEI
jgi:hypothetical protein